MHYYDYASHFYTAALYHIYKIANDIDLINEYSIFYKKLIVSIFYKEAAYKKLLLLYLQLRYIDCS